MLYSLLHMSKSPYLCLIKPVFTVSGCYDCVSTSSLKWCQALWSKLRIYGNILFKLETANDPSVCVCVFILCHALKRGLNKVGPACGELLLVADTQTHCLDFVAYTAWARSVLSCQWLWTLSSAELCFRASLLYVQSRIKSWRISSVR